MNILKPNNGTSVVQIPINFIYVCVTDYKAKFLLKQVKIRAGQHTWAWIPLKPEDELDVSQYGDDLYMSFDRAVNKMVNDAYSTVYSFSDIEEMVKRWAEIVYQSNITTVYQQEK